MKLYIDGIVFRWQIHGGISKIYRRILPIIMEQHADIKFRIDVPEHVSTVAMDLMMPCIGVVPMLPSSWRPWRFWSRVRPIASNTVKSFYMRRFKPDVFHSTFYTLPPTRTANFCFVYDMTVERYPEMFPNGYADENIARKRATIMNADLILCISENTRRDVIDLMKIPEDRCRVVHLGAEAPLDTACEEKVKEGQKPFFLYVGDYQAEYKNFKRLIEFLAADNVSEFNDTELLVISPVTPKPELLAQYHSVIGASRLRFITDCDDEQLGRLYRSCAALLYPSLYEGFGMPVLDALANGAPVVCSNTSSLPEVGGKHAYYFDPLSNAEFSAALRHALSHGRDQVYVEQRKAWAQRFSWENTAAGFAQACYDVVGNYGA